MVFARRVTIVKESIYMPIITVKMLEGRTDEQKEQMIKKMTDVMVETTGARAEAVSIIIEEMNKANYGVAGKRLS
ncbi:4-oxalocrotonate tautomerase [Terribacillus saccharophilus]|uniref:Tautomerase n=2 Tax=Terribacillus saccharophilus TaxID=361277 RepID=A0A268HH45_9BACI|nr:4-oxalocrotonate tautomerase [Terribacillus saccharophilus]PAD96867.1 4-oxalocrotonate tautomerase [Terribacillus saccharophilus]PAE00443.1 4-oxalocrotonate tautomerase [Terribacillus saccharophilus]PAE09192.1 4-oxalocrotonate tautomerase [Terribacillus saccharophilus]